MAGIRLEWAQFGDFDSFDVLRSDSAMDVNALPSPIATNLPTMFYVDTDVVEGVTYYYRVVAWRDGVSKISGEIKAKASEYLFYMPYSIDLNDKNGLFGTNGGSAANISDGSLYVQSMGIVTYDTVNYLDANIGTGDFEWGAEICMMPTDQGDYPCIFALGTSFDAGVVSMQFNASTKLFMAAFIHNAGGGEQDAFAPSPQIFDGVTFAKYVVRRISGVVTTYKDGIAGSPLNFNGSIDIKRHNQFSVGRAPWWEGTRSHCRIKNMYLKKL